MDKQTLTSRSKFLSLVLRHRPDKIGIILDEAGWVDIEVLLTACRENGVDLDLEGLTEIVATNDKQRFSLSEDGKRIRAAQGHSVDVSLGYEPREPPEILYHGTAERSLTAIRRQGLARRERQHVHLSRSVADALKVGMRHGKPVVLAVEAGRMHLDGLRLCLSDNRVWLTESVPPGYLRFPGEGELPKLRSCGFILFRRKPSLSFLLLEHKRRLDIPKGHLEAGESDLACAFRELEEETGVSADLVRVDDGFCFELVYHPTYKRYRGIRVEKTLVVLLGYLDSDVDIEVSEHRGHAWVPWDPPHRIQAKTIDPLLAAVAAHFMATGNTG